jgi:hypothetical protein
MKNLLDYLAPAKNVQVAYSGTHAEATFSKAPNTGYLFIREDGEAILHAGYFPHFPIYTAVSTTVKSILCDSKGRDEELAIALLSASASYAGGHWAGSRQEADSIARQTMGDVRHALIHEDHSVFVHENEVVYIGAPEAVGVRVDVENAFCHIVYGGVGILRVAIGA